MWLSIVALLIAGLFLIVIEAVLPGWVAGTLGALAIAGSAALCFKQYGPEVGTVYLVVSVILAGSAAFAAFQLISKRLAIRPPLPSKPVGDPERGARGVVVSQLRPTGIVEIEGRRFQARCETSEQQVEPGGAVTVVGRDSTFLVVQASAADAEAKR